MVCRCTRGANGGPPSCTWWVVLERGCSGVWAAAGTEFDMGALGRGHRARPLGCVPGVLGNLPPGEPAAVQLGEIGPAQVPDPAGPLEPLRDPGVGVKLQAINAMPGPGGVGVVRVVPVLAERQEGQRPE